MTPTIKTSANSIQVEQKMASLISAPAFNFRLTTANENLSSNFSRNSLLNDDKLLKSLENTFLKMKPGQNSILTETQSSKFSTESRLDLGSKISSFESSKTDLGRPFVTENKFLTNDLLENRLLDSGISSKFDTSSKISTTFEKLPTSFSTIAPQFSAVSNVQSQLSDALRSKNLSTFDGKQLLCDGQTASTTFDRKRKPNDKEITIVEEVYHLTFDVDRDGPAPSKRSKFLENELKEKKKTFADELKENCKNKLNFVNCIAGSLISGPKFFSPVDETRKEIIYLADKLVDVDPEFILKVALYTRCDLNIRTTANFLLAYAANHPQCRKYLKKYFISTIRLPSDWIEVVELYSSLMGNKPNNKPCPLPNALRNVMVEKFATFDEYQLAKHNKNKKTNKGKKKMAEMQAKDKLRGRSRMDRFSRAPPPSAGDDDNDNNEDDAPKVQQTKKLNLKKLIRQLHIQKPANFVMGILGKKYPSDSLTFHRSGLLGVWEEERSGKRMKLAIPETWETQIATRGNKAEVWQDLLDHKKLPYMALLRNLRNIIKSGVDEKYHKMILQRLENENAVMNSKQFPFRFFSAYHVLDQLVEEYNKKIEEMSKAGQNSAKLPTKAIKKGKVVEWWVRKRAKKLLQTTINYDETLINRYRKALDNAVRIATVRNVKPIHGRTVVYCNVDEVMHTMPCSSAKGLGKPRTIEEIGLLLSLMCTYVCEDSKLFLFTEDQLEEAKFSRGTILDNMSTVLAQAENLRAHCNDVNLAFQGAGERSVTRRFLTTLRSYLIDRSKVDNILLIDRHSLESFDGFESVVTNFLSQYRRLVNDQTLYVNINLSANLGISRSSDVVSDQRNVYLKGYSDQILRYVAERGSADQLNHVENIDLAYDLTKTVDKPKLPFKMLCDESFLAEPTCDSLPNTVRVFISSTFRDMQSERNILLRYVFPELQRRARAKFAIDIVPVDLRWGITESQAHSHSSVNLCLQQVSKCQFFVGFLGERYGYRIPDYGRIVDESGLPYDWLKDYPPSASITELEIYKFALSNVHQARGRSFFYFRDPKFMNDLPEMYLDLMTEKNDPTAAKRLNNLKSKIFQTGLPVYKDYPWKFDGVRDDLPHLSQLQPLAQRVLDELWSNISAAYENYDGKTTDADDIRAQWSFVKTTAKKFVGREKLMTLACTCFKKQSSGLFLISSNGPFGKTSFMAALSEMIRNRQEMYGSPIVCFRDALIGRENIDPAQILYNYLIICTGKTSTTVDKVVSPTSWSEILTQLNECGYRLTFLLDGFDNSQIEWLFDGNFENVKFIVSVNENSSLAQSIVCRKINHRKIDLPELALDDRAKVVRNVLSAYGKNLDENAFNNQMRILLSKRDSSTPAYLLIACEQLRLFGSFENLNSMLRCMSSSVNGLIVDVLKKIEIDHERNLIEIILCFVATFDGELTQTDLYHLTSMTVSFAKLDSRNFEAVYEKYSRGFVSADFLPYSTFLFVYNALAPAFFATIPNRKGGENLINIKFHEISAIVRKFYVKNKRLYDYLKAIFAGYLWFCCDPQNDGAFAGIIDRHFALLPSALANGGNFKKLFAVLTNRNYVEKCFFLRAYVDFQQFFAILLKSYEKNQSLFIDPSLINDMQRFVVEKSEFLYKYPSLTNQEIKNQPKCSRLHELIVDDDAEKAANSTKIITWMNNPRAFSFCDRTSVVDNLTCVAVSVDTRFAAVGTKDGRVLLLDCNTGQEIHAFLGHCDAVSDVCFLDDHGNTLASCSSGGAIFVWNTRLLTKIATLTAHSGYVSMCRPFKWGKVINLISVGWDSTVRLWNYLQSKEINSIKDKILNSPINCLDCHPTDQKIVFGLWNSKLAVYSVAPIERKAVLRGHLSSVRAVAYHPNGLFIVSASMDGEVKLWSSIFASQIGSFKGHYGPVTRLTYSNETLITAAEDSLLKVWSSLLGVPVFSVTAPVNELAATAVALNTDGKSFAVGYNSNKVLFYKFSPISQETTSVWSTVFSTSVLRLKFIPQTNLMFIVCRLEACIVSTDDGSVFNILQSDEGPMTGGDCIGECVVTAHANGVLCFYQNSEWATLDTKKRSRRTRFSPRAIIHGHTGAVNDCAFNSNGDSLASVGVDKNLLFWDVAAVLSHKSTTPNEKSLYSCHNDSISCCAWSDRKELLVTGSYDCTVKVWATDTMELLTTFTTHKGPITDVTVKRGCIVSASGDGTIAVWSAKGILVTQLKDESGCKPLCVEIVLQPKEETKLWAEIVDDEERENAVDESKADKLTQGFGSINFNEALLMASFTNGTARMWKPLLGHAKASLSSHTSSVIGLSSSAKYSTKFFSASKDGACKFWTLPGLNMESSYGCTIHSGAVMCAAVCPDGQFICTGGRDGKCAITTYYSTYADDFDSFSFVAHPNSVTGVVWLSSSSLVTSGEDGFVKFWAVDIVNQRSNFVKGLKLDHPISALAYNDNMLCVALWSGHIMKIVQNTGTNDEAKEIFCSSYGKWIESLKISSTKLVLGTSSPSDSNTFDSIYDENGHFTLVPKTSFATSAGRNDCFIIGCTDNGEIVVHDCASTSICCQWQAHSARITSALVFESGFRTDNFDDVMFCTVSHDRTLKIWKGSELFGVWESPSALSVAVYSELTKHLWCGDVLGGIYCLALE